MPDGCGRVQSSRFSGRLVIPDAVTVMDRFAVDQMAAQDLLSHEDVLEYVGTSGRRVDGRQTVPTPSKEAFGMQ